MARSLSNKRSSLYQSLRRLHNHIYVLGTHWADYREDWLRSTQSNGKPDRVLDAGCGQGEVLAEFAKFNVPVDYYGVDLAVGQRDWVFRVSALADLHTLPFKSGSFDKVICNQVLEHVDRPDDVLGELARVLRPGGRLFIAVPFVWHVHQEPYDRFRFTLHALEYLVRKHDLQISKIRTQGGYFTVVRYVMGSHGLVTTSLPAPFRLIARLGDSIYKWIDIILIAPVCYLLDQLDREHKLTLGYFLNALRPGADNKTLPDDPYCCPCCSFTEPQKLIQGREAWTCSSCEISFPVQNGVPNLTLPGAFKQVTENVSHYVR
jgi:SAM-dependent methyltransferase